MVVNIDKSRIRVIILDISGIYSQIYDEGYFLEQEVEDIKKKYFDTERWRVLVLDK